MILDFTVFSYANKCCTCMCVFLEKKQPPIKNAIKFNLRNILPEYHHFHQLPSSIMHIYFQV